MNDHEKQKFIGKELYHELRCLLGAVTVWKIFKKQRKGFDVVVAMDSAILHARCLFNFFCEKGGNDISIDKFGGEPYVSSVWSIWQKPLNRHVMHISKGRVSPTNLQKQAHLNEQPETFAKELLNLWKKAENDLPVFANSLTQARKNAIEDAENDTKKLIKPIFTFD